MRRKKSDPITERERALKAQLTALQGQIKRLNASLDQNPEPRWRSTAMPRGPAAPTESTAGQEPIFEDMEHHRIQASMDKPIPPSHVQRQPWRKSNLMSLWRRFQDYFHGTSPANPKLVSYLAAGSLQGLRPMRYEKRVARNRFLLLVVFFLAVLYGIFRFFSSRY
ncbi:MAG: hypothetical protein M1608_17465 [Candidatus Omnitrophica bacterium]|nr:hypothetical protein [Candidatus Omnitrophota bacterium]